MVNDLTNPEEVYNRINSDELSVVAQRKYNPTYDGYYCCLKKNYGQYRVLLNIWWRERMTYDPIPKPRLVKISDTDSGSAYVSLNYRITA
jgi:hypothetical protein